MTATKTVTIPASHRLTIDVPPDVPTGWLAVLTFTPSEDDTAEEDAPFLKLRGIYKGVPGASVDEFLARCREDKEYEMELEQRRREERARYAKKVPS